MTTKDGQEYYHCGDPSTDSGAFLCDFTLCGLALQGQPKTRPLIEWDHPENFVKPFLKTKPQCPKCLGHPDFPLLLLGEVGP